ncbi:hypothetical protein [Bacillus sp. MMSF_3328]|uniref:hypothetical protein n=1 Tax=Bacillus sp. MMSF_3328 TaxID=3047080 RepID=UPI00273FDAB1|nr:hypothetical protein [Bacillus sp. MMSF_3328]
MAFATVTEVRDQTSFGEVTALSDAKIEKYIDLANAYLRRYTGKNYRDETDPDRLIDLNRVTVLLVEYIWMNDQIEVKEANFTGMTSERIGTYSYNLGGKGEGTGNPELDQLLISLRGSIGLNLFSVNGPSRARKRNDDNPHAYVTDIEG